MKDSKSRKARGFSEAASAMALCAMAIGMLGGCSEFKRWMYEGFGRDDWQQPDRVIAELELEPGDRVADLGAGGGYFTLLLAREVGEGGRVFAVDIDPDMVEHIVERAREADLDQIEGVVAGETDPGLAPGSVDLIFVSNTYHHLPDPPDYFKGTRAALRPGGRIAIVELQDNAFPKGHDTPPEMIREQMNEAGYRLVAGYDYLERQSFQVFEVIE